MDNGIEKNNFTTRWFDASERDTLDYKIKKVIEEHATSGWKSTDVEMETNTQGQTRATIHLEREKTKTMGR